MMNEYWEPCERVTECCGVSPYTATEHCTKCGKGASSVCAEHPQWSWEKGGEGCPFAVEPGEVCPHCHEKTPNKHALEVRAWRKKSKTRGTERKSQTHAEGSPRPAPRSSESGAGSGGGTEEDHGK